MAMPVGTDVSVSLDGDQVRRGRVRDVSLGALIVWTPSGADVIPRGRIAHVSQRVDRGTSRSVGFVRATIVAGVISGVLGAVVAAMGENGLTEDDGVAVFAVGTLIGAAYGAARSPAHQYEDRLIYIRP